MKKNKKNRYVKTKSIGASAKTTFAIFCITLLLISVFSAGVGSFDAVKKNSMINTNEKKLMKGTRSSPHHPDITGNKDSSYVGNTGFEDWYYYIGDVVNPANGNLHITEEELKLPALGWGLGIEMARDYNSHNADYETMFGYGWTSSYNIYLIEQPDDSVIFVEGDGSFHNFTSLGGGNYTSPPGKSMKLKKNLDDSFTLKCCKGKTYFFDSSGTMQEMTDKNNNHLYFTYSGDYLVNITDDSGLWVSLQYNPDGYVSSITDTLGRTVTYEYDAKGDLRNVTDPMGNVTRYFYCDESMCPLGHHLIARADVLGRVVTFENILQPNGLVKTINIGNSVYNETSGSYSVPYTVINITYVNDTIVNYSVRGSNVQVVLNSAGNPVMVSETDCGCGAIYRVWDADMNLIQYTNERGYSWNYEYDEYGNILNETNPLGHRTSYVWETVETETKLLCLLKSVTDLRGSITSYGYDSYGNTINVTDATGNITHYSYDSHGSIVSIKDARGDYTNYTYDTHGAPATETDAEGWVTYYTYDDSRRLVNITDPNGNTILYEYDALNRMTKVTDPLGNTTDYEYDSLGNIIKVTDESGNTVDLDNNFMNQVDTFTDTTGNQTSYKYDKFGNLIEFTDFAGNPTKYYYDDLNRLIEMKDSSGNSEKYDYDDVGNIIEFTDKAGNITNYEYDPLNRLIRTVNADGAEFRIIYDDINNTVTEIDEEGRSKTMYYDILDRYIKTIDDEGKTVWEYEYDSVGNIIRRTNARDDTTIYEFDGLHRAIADTDFMGNTTHYTCDGVGNVINITDALGYSTRYEYDSLNRLIREIDALGNDTIYEHDANGNVVKVTDARGYSTDYEYDSLNRLIKITDALGNFTTYDYDSRSNLIAITDPQGHTTSYEYDDLGQIIRETDALGNSTIYDYDAKGNLISETDKRGFTTRYTYDSLDRIISIEKKDLSTMYYGYDDVGNIISFTDERGFVTTFEYDGLHRLVNRTDATGNITHYEYDENNNIIAITDSNLNTWAIEYDALDRRAKIISPLGHESRFMYDNVSNPVGFVDANGNITLYEYDPLNRLITIEDAIGSTIRYEYDENDNIIQIEDANQNLTNYEYDPLNRLIQIERYGDTTDFTYDSCGNRDSRTDGNGVTTSYQYDGLNRLIRTTYPDSTGIKIDYDEMDNIERVYGFDVVLPDGWIEYEYSYDPMGRVTDVLSSVGIGTDLHYGYDSAGNMVSFFEPSTGDITYEYDPLNRLINITDNWVDSTTFTYDAGGRRTRVDHPNGVYTTYEYNANDWLTNLTTRKSNDDVIAYYAYTYDNVGNRITEDTMDASVVYTYDDIYRLTEVDTTYSDMTTRLVEYTYDPVGNRLTMVVDGSSMTSYVYNDNKLVHQLMTSFYYDNNGNLIQWSIPIVSTSGHYTYDFENRLTQYEISTPTSSTFVNYTYSTIGDRISKETGGQSEYYVYSFEDKILEFDTFGILNVSYIHGPGIDEPLVMESHITGDKYYYHTDGLGSITQITDAMENIAASYEYMEFGNLWNMTETIQNDYQYTSRESDDYTGLYYYRTRYYDPARGRFITPDPLEMSFGTDIYIYVRNNPIINVDPYGLQLNIQMGGQTNKYIQNQPTFEYSGIGKGPVWFAHPSKNVATAIAAGFTGGLSYPDWNPKPKGKEPEYDGKCTCHKECCCWITKPGEFKFTYKVKYTNPGPQNTPGQAGTHSLTPGASRAINMHEDEHVRLAKMAHDTFIGPLMQRVQNYLGRKNAMKAGKTVEECIKKLKAFIKWKEAINKFLKWHDKLNKAGGVLDTADAGYIQAGPAGANPMPVTARDTFQQQQNRYKDLEKKQGKKMGEDCKNEGLEKTDNGHGHCVMCTLEPRRVPTPSPPVPPTSPTPVPNPYPNPDGTVTPSAPTPVSYPYPVSNPVALHPEGYAYAPTQTHLPVYYHYWVDTGIDEPISHHDGDYVSIGNDTISIAVINNGDSASSVDVDYTLERWSTLAYQYAEGFESPWVPDSNGDLAPPGYEVHNLGGLDTWTWGTYPYSGMHSAGLYSTFFPQYFEEWLVTDSLDFSDVTDLTLSFYYYMGITIFNSRLDVWASTDGQTEPGFPIWLDEYYPSGLGAWEYAEIDLASLEGEDNVHLAFVFTGDEFDFIEFDLDDILIDGNTNDWVEVDSGTNGPYDLDPDVWIESFFDVCYDFEGEYRATFSLDTPLKGDWSDDYVENDQYRAQFTAVEIDADFSALTLTGGIGMHPALSDSYADWYPFTVTVIHPSGLPIQGIPASDFEFTAALGTDTTSHCDLNSNLEWAPLDDQTDVNGEIRWQVRCLTSVGRDDLDPLPNGGYITITASVLGVNLADSDDLPVSSCDIDIDGDVDLSDFSRFAVDFGLNHQRSDYDYSGSVTLSDFSTFAVEFGSRELC